MKNIVIFASGSGSNAENIMAHFSASTTATVVAVFCNNGEAKVVDRAKNWNVPTVLFTKEELSSNAVLAQLQLYAPDLIILAGFLLKFPSNIIQAYPNKIINIHPALLPKYGGKGMYGMHVHKAVVQNEDKETGITIHYVNENYDEGNVIFQERVALKAKDSPEDVAMKVLELEHLFLPQVVEQLLNQ
jgi:phosphoribosylglycinamide formyltransferase-1